MAHSNNSAPFWTTVLSLIFQAAVAVGTLALTSIAIWGVFFTDIPESLVRQLRTDVADAQEQLADLRQERRQLESAIFATSQELTQTEIRRHAGRNEIMELEKERRGLKLVLEQLDTDRREYFRRMSQIYVAAFFENIEADLKELRNKIEMVRDYKLILEWVENRKNSNPGLNRFSSPKEIEMWRAWYDEWLEKRPTTWSRYMLLRGMFRRDSGVDDGARSSSDIVKNFMSGLTEIPTDSLVNGSKIISRHMKGNQLSLFLEQDQKTLLEEIEQFADAYSDVLTSPLDVSLPDGWNANTLPPIVAPVLEAHQRIEQVLPELRRRLLSLAGSSR